MELPKSFRHTERQRVIAASWLVSTLAVALTTLGLAVATASFWWAVLTILLLILTRRLLLETRSTLAQIEVDEVTMVYRRPGWLLIGEPDEIRVFVFSESTLHLFDESTGHKNSFIGCAIRSGPDYAYIADDLPERYDLIAYLLRKVSVYSMGEISAVGWQDLDNQKLEIRVRRTMPTAWLQVILMGFMAGLLNASVWDSRMKCLLVGVVLATLIGRYVERLGIPWGPTILFNGERLSRQWFGRERILTIRDIERVQIRDRLWGSEVTEIIGSHFRIRIRSNLPCYEQILHEIRKLRPELFELLDHDLPERLSCMAISLKTISIGIAMCSFFLLALFGTHLTSSFDPSGLPTFFASLVLGFILLGIFIIRSLGYCNIRDEEIVVKNLISTKVYPSSTLESIVLQNGGSSERKIVLTFRDEVRFIEIYRSLKTPSIRILHEKLCRQFSEAKSVVEGIGTVVSHPTPLEQLQAQLAKQG